MSASFENSTVPVWRIPLGSWPIYGVIAVALLVAFYPGLLHMVRTWVRAEEYSYGFFVPLIMAFMIWQKSSRLRTLEFRGSWAGLGLLALSALLCIAGRASAIALLIEYGFIVALFGVSMCLIGYRGTRIIAVPLAFSLSMIPLPNVLLVALSERLQLWSSQIGVALIRLCDISVYLEGNVIDLGSYKLQVVEACSGLRYLFPLMTLGFLAAYFFRASLWKQALLFVSTVPLTIVINSLRIAIIGVTVEYWGKSFAEGFVHTFEGWFMFMICFGLLIGEMAVLARIGANPKTLRASFGLDFPSPPRVHGPVRFRTFSNPLLAATVAVSVFALSSLAISAPEPLQIPRKTFASFSTSFEGGWKGRRGTLEPEILDILKLDDYYIADFQGPTGALINLYLAYYESQNDSEKTSHSPQTCIPGGGWKITDFQRTTVDFVRGARFPVNRVLIEKGEQRQLVYYWFKQGPHHLTNEYAVKWYIFRDSVTRSRTDGALIRLVTPLAAGERAEAADARLSEFVGLFEPRVAAFVPD